MSAGPPPWGDREPEPELTPDGRPILRTRFGPHVRDPASGQVVPYFSPAEETALTLAPMLRRRDEPVVAPADWSPW